MTSRLDTLDQFVDLDRYPIHLSEATAGHELIENCREMMRQLSVCALPGFLRAEAAELLRDEAIALEADARQLDFLATPYGWMNNNGYPDNHPRSRLFRRRCGAITAEQFPLNGVSSTLYQFDELTSFVRRLLGYDTLFRTECPTISMRLNVMKQDDEFGWHFDTNDGVVSFVLQNAEQGGVFEYAPMIRSEDDENYAEVEALFSSGTHARTVDMPAGCFVLFMGRRSAHRVTRVTSAGSCRHTLLFSYDRKPGMVFPERVQRRLLNPSSESFKGLN